MSVIDRPNLSNKYSLPPFSKTYFSGSDLEIILGKKFNSLKPSNTHEERLPDGLCSSTTTTPLQFDNVMGKSLGKGLDLKI